jgi:hypothetical protein
MRKIGLVALFLVACGRKHADLTIAITADGYVRLDGKEVTLDELGTALAARRRAGPLDEVASRGKASSLPVRLDVEDDALWTHVGWVMDTLTEQRFWRLSLPGGRDAPQPVDAAIECNTGPDGVALLARVLVLEDGRYVLGDHATSDVREIGKWMDSAPGDRIMCRIARIAGEPRVTWRLVRPVFDALRREGFKRIDLPSANPARDIRAMSPLPRPEARRGPFPWSWSWLRVVRYWSALDAYEGEFDWDPPVSADEELAALLDEHRSGLALPDFAWDARLCAAAVLHVEEMNRLGYCSHFSPVPGNRSPGDRLAKQGWPKERRYVELLAKADTAQAALDAILANAESAAYLADPAFKCAGVAESGDYSQFRRDSSAHCWVVLLGADR